MRLTLRTMLAYLDNILEPNDAEVLGAKISDSEFASELVYRTLSSTRKANLNAPPLEGRGIGGDPNSVAEYLDNTLDETRIPGFEKVCLESDMFLSEVACCHNILSICIDQPVTVENEIRDRVLSLVEASLAKTEDLVEIEPQSKFALDTLIEPKPAGAPEYIKKKAHPLWQATVITTFFSLISIIGLRAVGPFDTTHPWIGSMFSVAVEPNSIDSATGEKEQSDSTQDDQTLNVLPENVVQPIAVSEGLNITEPVGAPEVVAAKDNPTIFAPHESFAELLSDSQPLLRPSDGVFVRLVSGSLINVGDTVLGLEGFRPELLFNDGAKLTLAGATKVEFSWMENVRLGLQVHHGKIVIRGSDNSDLKIRLQAGETAFDLDFNGDSAVAALESVPFQMANGEINRAVRLFCSKSVTVTGGEAVQEIPDTHPESVTVSTFFSGNTSMTQASNFPDWANGFESDSIMEEARTAFVDRLSTSDDLVESLQQVYEAHRLINVRRLAAYGLLELGIANAAVGLLDNGDYRALWYQDVRLLQEYYHRDMASRSSVETALSSYSGDNTEQVLSFLSEYDDEHLLAGVADEMVQQLKSKVTASRVIAFERLKRITTKTLLYKPQESPQRQTLPIREWEQLLSEGKLINANQNFVMGLLSR